MPELAQKVKMFFALAPAVIIKHAKSPVMKMSFLLDRQFKIFQLLLGQTDASLRMRKLWRFLPDLCRHPVLHKPCATLLFLLGGYNEKNLNTVCAPLYPSCCHPKRRSPQAFCTCTACPQETCRTSWQRKEAPEPCQSN